MHKHNFGQTLKLQSAVITLDIGSRSSQSNFLTLNNVSIQIWREHSNSVIECLTRDREAAGLSLTGVTALLSLSKTHLS